MTLAVPDAWLSVARRLPTYGRVSGLGRGGNQEVGRTKRASPLMEFSKDGGWLVPLSDDVYNRVGEGESVPVSNSNWQRSEAGPRKL